MKKGTHMLTNLFPKADNIWDALDRGDLPTARRFMQSRTIREVVENIARNASLAESQSAEMRVCHKNAIAALKPGPAATAAPKHAPTPKPSPARAQTSTPTRKETPKMTPQAKPTTKPATTRFNPDMVIRGMRAKLRDGEMTEEQVKAALRKLADTAENDADRARYENALKALGESDDPAAAAALARMDQRMGVQPSNRTRPTTSAPVMGSAEARAFAQMDQRMGIARKASGSVTITKEDARRRLGVQ